MSEFAKKREFSSLDEVMAAAERDRQIGYVCRGEGGVMAFGDAFLGDIGIYHAAEIDGRVETHELVLYHHQETAIVGWLLATVAQGMTADERAALHAELMARIQQAEASVKPPEYHHEAFGAEYWGVYSANKLRTACTLPGQHPTTHYWQDAATMDAARPSIRMDMLADVGRVRISDEYEESAFELSYADAVNMAIGLTVYDRGRVRPSVIKQVYDGLLATPAAI